MIEKLVEKLPEKLTLKVCAFLAGVFNCFLGLAAYYLVVDKDKETAKCFGNGALLGVVVLIVRFVLGIFRMLGNM